MAAAAAAMVMLPLFYVALTGLAMWNSYRDTVKCLAPNWEMLDDGQGATIVKIVLTIIPLAGSGVVAFLMVGPLFARQGVSTRPLVLTEQDAPRIHALVAEVCRTVGARTPRRIELSCLLNASASLEGGARGFFGDGLILSLGLPLVAGLTQRELAGVLAHEFGHFRQGAGMRVSLLIRTVNGWFERIIYTRDAWANTPTRPSVRALQGPATIAASWMRLNLLFSRAVLWTLMMIGRVFSAGLSRQMEYDADRAEVAVAGSAAFESTSVKLVVLDAVFADLALDLQRVWYTKCQLPDNLPALLAHREQRLNPQRRARLENEANSGSTGMLDSHPCTADRVQRARRLAGGGLEFSEAPARDLFTNFEELSRHVTRAYYGEHLDVLIQPEFLVPLAEVLAAEASKPPTGPAAARPRKSVRLAGYGTGEF